LGRCFVTQIRDELTATPSLRGGGVKSFTEIGKTLDSRVKDLQEGTEAKLEATRGVLDRIRDTVDRRYRSPLCSCTLSSILIV